MDEIRNLNDMNTRSPDGTRPKHNSTKNKKINPSNWRQKCWGGESDHLNVSLRFTIIRGFKIANVPHKRQATQKEPRWAALRNTSRASSDYKY